MRTAHENRIQGPVYRLMFVLLIVMESQALRVNRMTLIGLHNHRLRLCRFRARRILIIMVRSSDLLRLRLMICV